MKQVVQQTGFTFGGFIQLVVILIFVAIFSMKLIPAYLENFKIQKAMSAIIKDPAMQAGGAKDIKESYQKRAVTMDMVTSVMPDDLVITKEGGRFSISAAYTKTIPLAGNVSLLVEFSPSASN